MAWTEDRVKKLTLLWKSGHSASKIAVELGEGVSRNAVIGKIHRLGLSERGSGSGPKGTKKPSKNHSDNMSAADKSLNDLISDPKLEQSEKRKGKKRGRKPSIKKLISNDGSSDSISKINKSLSSERDVLEVEMDQATLANKIKIEKNAKKLSLLELTEKTCKWPIGDPATSKFWFCGHPSEQGKPYCETHISIAFQPVTTRREKKHNKINN